MKNTVRDYKSLNDEIFAMEHRARLLGEEKTRAELELRPRVDQSEQELLSSNGHLDELRY